MGREAECACNCNDVRSKVKALIEPPDLILRGEIRRRLPIADLQQIRARDEHLHFIFQSERFSLALGTALAVKWAKALTAPPPTLAMKLGITGDTVARILGPIDDGTLREALASCKAVADENPNLILARVNTPEELAHALHSAADQLAARVPIWFIYPKGRGHELNETQVRSLALTAGIVDTKVASVSPVLTALRFVRRREP